MNNNTKLLPVLLFFTIFFRLGWEATSFAQTSNTFMRTFQAAGMNGGLSLAETSDGGFIGTGQHESSGAGSCDVYVYKVDACGNPEWFKTYGGPSEDGGKDIQQTSDGGYIVAGLSFLGAGNYDMLLLKLDASGNIEWSKVYGAGANDYGLGVRQTTDGGYILTGFLTGLGFGGEDVSLIKTDANGNLEWMKVYGGTGSDWGDYVEQTSDGGYKIVGYTTSFGAGGFDTYVIKVNSVGDLQWAKTYGGPAGDGSSQWGISGQTTSDGGFMICANSASYGAGSNDFLLIKTDSLGSLLWSKTYGGAADDQPRFAEETKDKGFILSGFTTSFGAGDLDAYLIKTDSSGNMQWSKAYGGAAYDKGSMVREISDGGYALSVVTASFGANYYDPLFMKTDSMGVVGCNETNCATIVNNVNPAVGSGGSEMIPAAVVAVPALLIYDFSPIDVFLCQHCITVPSFVPSDTISCVGETVFFYNTTTIGKTCDEDWFINGTVVNGDKDTLPFVFNTAGIHLIQLIARCGNSTDTNTISIHVYDYPVAAFGNTSVCNGDATQFTDSSTIASGTITNRSWDFGDGSPVNNTQNPSHIYTNAGTYNVTLTVNNAFGCSDTITKAVQVFYNPAAVFSSDNVCFCDSMYFSNSSTVDNSTSIAGYLWVFGDSGPTNSLQNPVHYYSGAGTYTVTLVTTTIDGCSDAATNTVNAFDAPASGVMFSNTCLFEAAAYTNSTTGPVMGTTAGWLWNFGDGTAADTSTWSPNHLYAAPGNYQVTLITYSSNLACVDTLQDTITVFPMPLANFSSVDRCLNQTMNFIDSSTVSSGTIAGRSWDFGDGSPLSTLQDPGHTYTNPGTYSVSLIVTTNTNCKDTVTKNVVVHPLPVAQFSTSNVCDGSIVPFGDLSTIITTDTIQEWAWNFGDGSPVFNNPNTSHLYAANGSYPVQLSVVSNFGCSDSITKISIINPNPVVNFTASDTVGCETLCVIFQNVSSIATGNNAGVIWNFGNNGSVNNSENPTRCYVNDSIYAPGFFDVSLTVNSDSGCVTTLLKDNYITVYPNPNAAFTVQPETATITDPVISIKDLSVGVNFWNWNFGDGSDSSSVFNPGPHTYADTGVYTITLIVSTQYNCIDTADETVIIEPDFVFYIPNAFTPNDDGVNDTFTGRGIFVHNFEMSIFDRWGNLVFFSDDINKPWDGKANRGNEVAQGDVYIYSIKLIDFKKGKHSYKGIVTLVR